MKKLNFMTFAAMLAMIMLAMTACKKEKVIVVTGIIIAPTGDLSVDVGATTTVTATVTPATAANKTIHWSSLDPGIATVSVSTGVVTGVSPGTATILATAADGGGATATKTVTVKALVNAQTPAITTQPQSAAYAQNTTASALSVTASVTDGGALSYQWFSNATNSTSGGTPVGANSSYTPPTTSVGALYYYVVVTNTNNSVNGTKTAATTSAVATITVNALVHAQTPTITTQPQSATYTQNTTASALSVTASVTDGGTLSYQWFSNATNSTSGGTPVGANSAYTPPTTSVGALYYYVVITNTNNSVNGAKTATTTSAVATITVTEIPTYTIIASPTSVDFGSQQAGYAQPPAQTVTIINNGNQTINNLTAGTLTGYTISAVSPASLAPNATATLTVRPNAGLAAGGHNGAITISGSNGASATVSVTFEVTAIPTYTLSASSTSLNFGSLQTGYTQPTAQTVTITNTGNQTITNLTAGTLTGYTVGTLSATSLAPNATATFTVRPNAGLGAGTHNGTITISGSNGTSAMVSATFTVTETPTYTLSASPATLSFGSLQTGYTQPAAQTVTITNTGNQTITGLTRTTLTGYTIGTLSATSLAPNATATFTVRPNANLTAGTHNGTITISGSNSTSATVGVSFTVTTAPTYTISASPTTLSFGSLQTGYTQPAAQTVTIRNTGNQTITGLTRSILTGYTIGTLSATSIAPNATATFTVRPNAGLAAGTHNGTITISGSNGTSASVSVAFTVTAPSTYTISAAPAILSFGSVQPGYTQPAAQTVTITNTGNQTITGLSRTTLTGYTIGTLSATSLAPNATATFTVRPNAGLASDNHNGTITISGSNGVSATVRTTFTVTAPAKSVVVGAQNGQVIAGTTSTVTFPVTTTGFDNGNYSPTLANRPTGVTTITGYRVSINNNIGTLTLGGNASTVAGVYTNLTLTIDGVTSAPFTLVISSANPIGTVSFASSQTWTITGNGITQIWSDAVVSSPAKTTFDGGVFGGPYKVDYRNNPGYKGSLYSWEAVNQYKSSLCPSPWRVPTQQDFINLDIALGGTGSSSGIQVTYAGKYISDWGGQLTGFIDAEGAMGSHGLSGNYWSQTQGGILNNTAYALAYQSALVYAQSQRQKNQGQTVRCVR